jgi:PST family polysaccharide transporter
MPVAQIVLRNMVIDKVELILPVTGRDDAHSDGYLMLVTMSLSTYYLPKLSSLLSNGELRTEIFQGCLPVLVSCLPIYFFAIL